MTNEELAKSIDSKVTKIENRFQMRMIGLLFLEIFGFILIGLYSSYLDSDVSFMIGLAMGMALLLFFGIWITKTHKHNKEMRDYIWNLVRQDECNRCMTKMEQYEHEGSK